MKPIFADHASLAIGAMKANTGHLLTASGMAAIIKVVKAMEHRQIPATIHVDGPLAELAQSPFRLVTRNEPWETSGPRIAAVNSFGFGGNNAHLLLEEYDPLREYEPVARVGRTDETHDAAARLDRIGEATEIAVAQERFAVVGIGIAAQGIANTAALIAACAEEQLAKSAKQPSEFVERSIKTAKQSDSRIDSSILPSEQPAETDEERDRLTVTGDQLAFPPNDLRKALPQQLLLFNAVNESLAAIDNLPSDRTGIFIGMQCDSEIARHIARIRIPQWVREWASMEGTAIAGTTLEAFKSGFAGVLDGATVLGLLPNIPANRLHKHFKIGGPGFTVSAEQLSGIRALEIALSALQRGELDVAVAGAVDLSDEIVQQQALRAIYGQQVNTGDAAVSLVLKRLTDATAAGDPILAIVSESAGAAYEHASGIPSVSIDLDRQPASCLNRITGYAHAASGLLEAATWMLSYAIGRPIADPALPLGAGGTTLHLSAFGRQSASLHVSLVLPQQQVRVASYAGEDRRALLEALRDNRTSEPEALAQNGRFTRHRVVISADNVLQLHARRGQAIRMLETEAPTATGFEADGVCYRSQPVQGQIGFVYTGAATAYPAMSAELITRFPEIYKSVRGRFAALMDDIDWALAAEHSPAEVTPFRKLCASSFLCHFHTEISRTVLQLEPDAAIGLSSGETNALSALGAWDSMEQVFHDLRSSGMYDRLLAGTHEVLAEQWGEDLAHWENWRLIHPVPLVQQVVENEPYVTITTIHTDNDCIIGGHPEHCKRVIRQLGCLAAVSIEYPMVIHCEECAPVSAIWRDIHRRPAQTVERIRFYNSATYSHAVPEQERTADALLEMALKPIDFRRLIRQAYDDGVTLFIEHGPRDLCAKWIKEILGDQSVEVISMDAPGSSPVGQSHWARIVIRLLAAGARLNPGLYEPVRAPQISAKPLLTVPMHPPQVRLPSLHSEAHILPWAPRLPSILGGHNEGHSATDRSLVHASAAAPSAEMMSIHRQISTAHRQYVQLMSGAFRSYLAQLPSLAGQSTLPRVPDPVLQSAPKSATTLLPKPSPESEASPASLHRSPGAISFNRRELEMLASGRISDVFGPMFAIQDDYEIQVRMPEPPLLLADRVTAVEGEPGSMGTGTIRTETDVTADAWYLHHGRMPFGIMVESGQADLLLISWLGVDFINRGERMYRLLGCELTVHGPLPQSGDTLQYEIHVDRHAALGDTRLFFFHYDLLVDGQIRMSMRGGQAGFFTRQELDASQGVLWDPAGTELQPDARVEAPLVESELRQFDAAQMKAFSEGKLSACFGERYRLADTHVRSPAIQGGDMLLLQQVTCYEPYGGPWKRGYLRAETMLSGTEWFFPCHFKGDPAMPGTLMLEGCLQAMSFYMAAYGYTLARDGWRFEPVHEERFVMVCRGQATPQSRHLQYEVFVEEIFEGPHPTLYADVLLTVDGRKAFHCRRLGLRLISDWPLYAKPEWGAALEQRSEGVSLNGFVFDYASLLACAWGKPSEAFGPRYVEFDGTRRLPRLPGPPYHFMSKIKHIEGDLTRRLDVVVEVEYDIPPDAWYFAANGTPVMPMCVLMEAALQPCGWITALVGIPLECGQDLSFRNLDGTGTLYRALMPNEGAPLESRVKLLSVSRVGDTFIEAFEVQCMQNGELVFEMKTVFGHFPSGDLLKQAGLPASEIEQELIGSSNASEELRDLPVQSDHSVLRMPEAPLLMIDRIVGYWPDGGAHEVGCVLAEKTVAADAWFFKAHFFQDPVQPGSLGIEAMLQTLQWFMLRERMDAGFRQPVFEPMAVDVQMTWKYRGQVLPTAKKVQVLLQVKQAVGDGQGRCVFAEASLWVDGMKIYEVSHFGMRIREGDANPQGSTGPVDLQPIRQYWRDQLQCRDWIVEDLFEGLARQFVISYHLEDETAYRSIIDKQQPVLYVANHQTAIESLLFVYLTTAISRRTIGVVAKQENRDSWIGQLLALVSQYPGIVDFISMFYVDRGKQATMLETMQALKRQVADNGMSLLVHVEGTRALKAGQPIQKISSVFIDLAIDLKLPIVPVRFCGGLPIEPLRRRTEFPYQCGTQSIHIGKPIRPEELDALSYAERARRIRAAINETGGGIEGDRPSLPDASFHAQVKDTMAAHGVDEIRAVLWNILGNSPEPSDETKSVLHSSAKPGEETGSHLHSSAKPGEEAESFLHSSVQATPKRPTEAWLERFTRWLYAGETRGEPND